MAGALASYPAFRPHRAAGADLRLTVARAGERQLRREAANRYRAACPPVPLSVWAVLRGAISHALAPGGALLHTACAAIGGRAMLFLAPPEGGKTTVIDLLEGEANLVGDEAAAVFPDPERPGHFRVQGTACWSGRFRMGAAGSFPVAALCFLRKGPLAAVPMTGPAALRELLPQCYLTDRPRAAAEVLDFGLALVASAPAFGLTFPLGADLAPALRRILD